MPSSYIRELCVDTLVYQIRELGFEKHVVKAIKRYFGGQLAHRRYWLWTHFNQHSVAFDTKWRMTMFDICSLRDDDIILLWSLID